MEWKNLLSPRRIRELAGGRSSVRTPSEARSEIGRDYGRAVFATPVRRLQDKAQVFPLEPIDAVRTRLTHSLEVSSVARGLAARVARKLCSESRLSIEEAGDVEAIAATCGLLHDIGNPPFGHFGENAIRDWFRSRESHDKEFFSFDKTEGKQLKNDLINFEGNAQTLRLLCKLQVLSDRHGLNLTAATVSALQKYTASSTELGHEGRQSKKKLGHFAAEQEVVNLIRRETGSEDNRNPIALLVEASDDIVYSIVDIEDGIKKGVIDWALIKEEIKKADSAVGSGLVREAENQMNRSEFQVKRRHWEEGVAQYLRTFLIVKATEAVETVFWSNYDSIMAGGFDKEILFESSVGHCTKHLKM